MGDCRFRQWMKDGGTFPAFPIPSPPPSPPSPPPLPTPPSPSLATPPTSPLWITMVKRNNGPTWMACNDKNETPEGDEIAWSVGLWSSDEESDVNVTMAQEVPLSPVNQGPIHWADPSTPPRPTQVWNAPPKKSHGPRKRITARKSTLPISRRPLASDAMKYWATPFDSDEE